MDVHEDGLPVNAGIQHLKAALAENCF